MSRTTPMAAATRVQRLLAILQWVAAQDDGAAIAEVCDRFELTHEAVVKELQMASMIGADSTYYDEMPFEVIIEDGRVWARLFSFDHPLRLTPAEGFALVTSADALLGESGDPEGPLARALDKLAALLGMKVGEALDVDLDSEGGEVGQTLRAAIDASERVRFTYWSYGRDVVGTRVVEPWSVFVAAGSWYLAGLAVEVEEVRRFRLDRMLDVELTGEPSTARRAKVDTSVVLAGDIPRVVLELAADSRWVAEAHPVVNAEPTAEGGLLVTLAVAGTSWLERLLLQIGPSARVVEIDPALGDLDVLSNAAARVLDRYRDRGEESSR